LFGLVFSTNGILPLKGCDTILLRPQKPKQHGLPYLSQTKNTDFKPRTRSGEQGLLLFRKRHGLDDLRLPPTFVNTTAGKIWDAEFCHKKLVFYQHLTI
jgi:hypothetical protein